MSTPYTPTPEGYPQQPAYAMSPAEVESLRSNATVVLVLGILGLLLIGWFGSIPAWVWGNSIIKKAEAAGIPSDVVSNAKIGKVLGMIGTILGIVAIVFVVIFFGAFITAILTGTIPAN